MYSTNLYAFSLLIYPGYAVKPKYGLKDDLVKPAHNLLNIAHEPNINSSGLSFPDRSTQMAIDANKQQARVSDARNNFNENPGNIVGNQVVEQTQTGVNVVKNAAGAGKELMYDLTHPDEIAEKH